MLTELKVQKGLALSADEGQAGQQSADPQVSALDPEGHLKVLSCSVSCSRKF